MGEKHQYWTSRRTISSNCLLPCDVVYLGVAWIEIKAVCSNRTTFSMSQCGGWRTVPDHGHERRTYPLKSFNSEKLIDFCINERLVWQQFALGNFIWRRCVRTTIYSNYLLPWCGLFKSWLNRCSEHIKAGCSNWTTFSMSGGVAVPFLTPVTREGRIHWPSGKVFGQGPLAARVVHCSQRCDASLSV